MPKISFAKAELDKISKERPRLFYEMLRKKTYAEAYDILQSMEAHSARECGEIWGCENPSVLHSVSVSQPNFSRPHTEEQIIEKLKRSKDRCLPIHKVDTVDLLGTYYTVKKCNKCLPCLRVGTAIWSDRALVCFDYHGIGWLITRTFEDPEPGIDKAKYLDWKFRNSLNMTLKRAGIEYSAQHCLEYGSKTHRKHFHTTLNGLTREQVMLYLGGDWQEDYKNLFSYFIPKSKLWPHGHCHVAPIDGASMAKYSAKYCRKAQMLDLPEFAGERHIITNIKGDALQKNYFSYPRSPGLGDRGINKLCEEQKDRLIEQYRDPHNYCDKVHGSQIGVKIENRNLFLGDHHKKIVAAKISGWLGQEIEPYEVFRSDHENRTEAIRDAVLGTSESTNKNPVTRDQILGTDIHDPTGLYKFENSKQEVP